MTRRRPLRIGLMVEDFPVISETFVINMAVGLLSEGHDVDLLVVSGRRPPSEAMHATVARWGLDERVHRPVGGSIVFGRFERGAEGEVPRRWGIARRALAFLSQAAMLVRRPRYDVVHCQFAHLGLAAQRHRRMGTLRTDRLVVHLRGQDMTSYVRAHGEDVYRQLFATADLLVANSRHFRDRAIDLGASPDRTIVIGSAVDCTQFTPAPDARSADIGGEPAEMHIRLISIGRLVAKKGHGDAIRAVARLAPRHPHLRLDIVGDGPLRAELSSLVDELGVGDHVTLAGALTHDEIVDRLGRAQLLLAPSVTAPSGDQDAPVNSLKEAMAMEVPVIGTRHGGIPELVDPGVTGYLVDENDPDGLAAVIEEAILARAEWGRMGCAGRRRILDEYDVPVVTARLVAAYRSLFDPAEPAS